MRTKKIHKFDGTNYEITKRNIGKGGQGTVHKARRKDDRGQIAVIKEMPYTPDQQARIGGLIDFGLGYDLPFVSAPLSLNYDRRADKLFYLATYCDGVSLENDQPRSFPHLLEMATLFSHIWSGLEDKGIAHGDVSFTNVMISPDGRPELIDIDNYSSTQLNAPQPTKRGQHPVMAPELRGGNHNDKVRPPNLESDRFAWGIVLSFLLLGRHCCDGLVDNNPSQFEKLMTGGVWPEHLRIPEHGETPVQALGDQLPKLFEKAFSARPQDRPRASDWKVGFTNALDQLYVHECGGAFVVDDKQSVCPHCHRKIDIQQAHNTFQLVFRHLDSGVVSKFSLIDGQYMYIGRNNLKNASSFVSSRHLRIMKQGSRLYLAHVGKNPTKITMPSISGRRLLSTLEASINNSKLNGAVLQLADSEFKLSLIS